MQNVTKCLSVAAVCLLIFLEACAHSASVDAERRLAAAKPQIMSADYRADLAELQRLREQIEPLRDDARLGYLAHYWTGFASWRVAINGASKGMHPEDLKANLEKAAADFDASVRLRDDFADSYAAAASINGWLIAFLPKDADTMRRQITKSDSMLVRAKELAPHNPRVLWVEGGNFLFRPPQYGGDQARAIQIYKEAIVAADAAGMTRSPLPDWGKPEAFMALAYAQLNNKDRPDLEAAMQNAQAALRLQPEWSYVKDILVPQIEAARRK
jgi:hypothetical protein